LNATVELLQCRLARKAGAVARSAKPLATTAAAPKNENEKGTLAPRIRNGNSGGNADGVSRPDSVHASGARNTGMTAEEALVMSWSNLRWSPESLVSNA